MGRNLNLKYVVAAKNKLTLTAWRNSDLGTRIETRQIPSRARLWRHLSEDTQILIACEGKLDRSCASRHSEDMNSILVLLQKKVGILKDTFRNSPAVVEA